VEKRLAKKIVTRRGDFGKGKILNSEEHPLAVISSGRFVFGKGAFVDFHSPYACSRAEKKKKKKGKVVPPNVEKIIGNLGSLGSLGRVQSQNTATKKLQR